MKECVVCHITEEDEPIFHGDKCRSCYNAERLAYYHEYKKNGKTKESPCQGSTPTDGLIICRTCSEAKPVDEFYKNKTVGKVTYYSQNCKECVKGKAIRKRAERPSVNPDIRFKNAVITYRDGSVVRFDDRGKKCV